MLYWATACISGGAVASWLVCPPLYQPLWIRAQAGDIVLHSWARYLTLLVPLSTQVYKRVLVNLMLRGNLRWSSIPSRGRGGGAVEIPLVSSCCRNQRKAHPLWTTWLICGLYFTACISCHYPDKNLVEQQK